MSQANEASRPMFSDLICALGYRPDKATTVIDCSAEMAARWDADPTVRRFATGCAMQEFSLLWGFNEAIPFDDSDIVLVLEKLTKEQKKRYRRRGIGKSGYIVKASKWYYVPVGLSPSC